MVTIHGEPASIELTKKWILRMVDSSEKNVAEEYLILSKSQREHFVRADGKFLNVFQKIIDKHHVKIKTQTNAGPFELFANDFIITGYRKRVK